jgi:hypothetical protein
VVEKNEQSLAILVSFCAMWNHKSIGCLCLTLFHLNSVVYRSVTG